MSCRNESSMRMIMQLKYIAKWGFGSESNQLHTSIRTLRVLRHSKRFIRDGYLQLFSC